jgi:hypothetical protein
MGLISLVSWITRKLDQKEWEASGQQKAMLEQLAKINQSVASAAKISAETKKMSDAELDRILKDD